MNEIVNIDPATGEIVPAGPQVDPEAKADFDLSRAAVTNSIAASIEVLEVAKQVAMKSQDWKAIESFSKLVTAIGQASQDLLDARIKYETAIAVADPEPVPQTVNNNLFVGSVDEFLKKLKPNQDRDADDDLDL